MKAEKDKFDAVLSTLLQAKPKSRKSIKGRPENWKEVDRPISFLKYVELRHTMRVWLTARPPQSQNQAISLSSFSSGGTIFDFLRAHGRAVLICATIAFCFYQLSAAIRSFSGQITFASVTLRILGSIIFQWSITISLTGISLALYLREKIQHEKTRERLTQRVTQLETRINATRTSSQLTTKGHTRKEDE